MPDQFHLDEASALTAEATARLERLEGVIERGLQTFVEVGNALREIRDSRLYRQTHESFDAYCRDRWGFSRQTGYDLMQTAEIATAVQDLGHTSSREEARALAALRDDPESLRDTVAELTAAH